MRTGRLFWGVFLATIGLLILAAKFNYINADWSFVWNLWPLVFIFWGLLVLIKHPIIKPVISALFGVFIALFIFGSVNSLFWGFGFEFDDDYVNPSYTETLEEDMNKDITRGELNFSSGAGAFSINGETDKLIKGYSRGWFSNYDLNTNVEGNTAYVDVHLHERNIQFFGKKIRNRFNMELNPNIAWDMDLNFGAANAKFDLSPYKIENLKLSTGAATVQVKLGDKADTTEFRIEMGVANLEVLVPKTVGCRIYGDSFLVSRSLSDFTKKGDGHYYSSNYDSTAKKVNIYLSSGVSSFTVKYY